MQVLPEQIAGTALRMRPIGARERERFTMEGGGYLLRFLGKPCPWCGHPMSRGVNTPRAPTRDHRIPQARGGSDAIENIVICCATCNNEKGHLLPDEFMAVRTGQACRLDRLTNERRAWLALNPDVNACLEGHRCLAERRGKSDGISVRRALNTALAVLRGLR
jgi:hypothetical protein